MLNARFQTLWPTHVSSPSRSRRSLRRGSWLRFLPLHDRVDDGRSSNDLGVGSILPLHWCAGIAMRWWTKKAFVAVSAVLGILVYSMQFKKSCEDASPYACVMSLVSWVGHGMLTPRDVATRPPQQKPPPEPVKKAVADTPKASTTLSLATGIGPAVTNDGRDRRLAVVNAGNVILESVFATSCASRNWGHDMLGNKMISVGQTLTFNFDDGSGTCCFDLRAKFQNGVQRTNMGVNVCDVSRWTVDNR